MENILFRGEKLFNKNNDKVFVSGYYRKDIQGREWIYTDDKKIQVVPLSVGQSIDFKDKHNTPIYTNDRIVIDNEILGVIGVKNGSIGFYPEGLPELVEFYGIVKQDNSNIEVISEKRYNYLKRQLKPDANV